jgi:hypothetical protein
MPENRRIWISPHLSDHCERHYSQKKSSPKQAIRVHFEFPPCLNQQSAAKESMPDGREWHRETRPPFPRAPKK